MRKLFISGLAMLAATALCFDAGPLLAIVGAEKMPADAYLVAWYKLDGDATDSGLGGYDGTPTGGTWTNGVYGQAHVFKGAQPINTPVDLYAMGIRRAATFSVWVNIRALTEASALWGDWDNGSPQRGGHMRVDATGAVVFYVYPGNYRITTSAGVIGTGTWRHLVGVMETTSIKLYVDGTQIGSAALGGDVGNSAVTLMIGGRGDSANSYSWIDDFRIYNRAISSNDVGRIYQGMPPLHD